MKDERMKELESIQERKQYVLLTINETLKHIQQLHTVLLDGI